jgi:hypothetical protein
MARDRMSEPACGPNARMRAPLGLSRREHPLERSGYNFLTIPSGDEAVIDPCGRVGEARRNGLPKVSSEVVVPALSAYAWNGRRHGLGHRSRRAMVVEQGPPIRGMRPQRPNVAP